MKDTKFYLDCYQQTAALNKIIYSKWKEAACAEAPFPVDAVVEVYFQGFWVKAIVCGVGVTNLNVSSHPIYRYGVIIPNKPPFHVKPLWMDRQQIRKPN